MIISLDVCFIESNFYLFEQNTCWQVCIYSFLQKFVSFSTLLKRSLD